jgi:PTH2 family peptidyl-tRNA hydrolase
MFKQIIIIRKDLNMDVGKMVAQGAHASIGAFMESDEKTRNLWLKEGAKKIILKVNDLKELKEIEKNIRKIKAPYFLVADAGLTQLESGTVTALGIGPVEEKLIDKITGKLKLL